MDSEVKVLMDRKDDVTILNMEGDITSFAEEEILSHFNEGLDGGAQKFLLDFSSVEYINSSGIAIIIQLLSSARKKDAKVLCCGLSPHFQKVFEMVGLKKYTEMYDSSEEAITHF